MLDAQKIKQENTFFSCKLFLNVGITSGSLHLKSRTQMSLKKDAGDDVEI